MSDERDELNLEAWEPQAPPPDFAEKVLARVRSEEKPASKARTRKVGAAVGAACALSLAAAVMLRVTSTPSQGEAIAAERTEVSVGSRARAVLEPGAELSWEGDDVVQSKGSVFYRVEPGARFRVHTPAGDVEVKGTCFLVKVTDMQKRDLKIGAVGAALGAMAFVGVYEGKVAVSHAGESVELRAGESARTGPDGVKATGTLAEGERAFEDQVEAAASASDDPLAKANENLVAQIAEYRKRLEAIAAQKQDLEEKLAATEEKLAAADRGGRNRSEWDLDQEDWAELAKRGEVKYRVPCGRSQSWTPSPATLNELGLAPDDVAVIRQAMERSHQRTWAQIRPLCLQAVGNAEVVDKIGLDSCTHIIHELQVAIDEESAREAHTAAAEIRAGIRPEPSPNDKVHPVTKMFLVLSGASQGFEEDLAKTLGPDEAHRIATTDKLCWASSRWGGGKKRP